MRAGLSRRGAVLSGAAIAGLALLIAASPAHAGDYVVAQCHPANYAHEASDVGSIDGDYATRDECAQTPDEALKVVSITGAQSAHQGNWHWAAPTGTRIVGVDVEAKLRRADGHKARLYMANAFGEPTDRFATGGTEATDFIPEHWEAAPGESGRARFYAALVCDNGPDNCPQSDTAKAFVRSVELTLRDTTKPAVTLSGDAVSGGWKRATAQLKFAGEDSGSGIREIAMSANAASPAAVAAPDCAQAGPSELSQKLSPCPLQFTGGTLDLETGSPPFADGVNTVEVCASDFATIGVANVGCRTQSIKVDNTPPLLAFHSAQDPADPELIQADASDQTSGLAADSGLIECRSVGVGPWRALPTQLVDGVLEARVDSEAEPAGEYEFRASVADEAGNAIATSRRADGADMVLSFPLKEEPELVAFLPGGRAKQVVPYRGASEVGGYLLDDEGAPIPDAELRVRQRFDEGSLIKQRTDAVMTGPDGAFSALVQAGPSRQIEVSYDGSRRYSGAAEDKLDFNVKSRVALDVQRRVRAGESALFQGRVGRYFARIPDGGKLVELQFKRRAKTWNTAKEALGTTERGRIKIAYRFRRYYTQPVTFVFRLKATRENGWPYRTPATSRRVRVTVVPRRG